MTPDLIFTLGTATAAAGWIVLLASRWIPRWAEWSAGVVIPSLLAIAYAGLVLAFWSGAEGGFDSLDNVARLFQTREILLAGWLHYLAFDLFVGAWEVRTARAERIPLVFVAPCLALTFYLGPIGFLAFQVLRALRARMVGAAAA